MFCCTPDSKHQSDFTHKGDCHWVIDDETFIWAFVVAALFTYSSSQVLVSHWFNRIPLSVRFKTLVPCFLCFLSYPCLSLINRSYSMKLCLIRSSSENKLHFFCTRTNIWSRDEWEYKPDIAPQLHVRNKFKLTWMQRFISASKQTWRLLWRRLWRVVIKFYMRRVI